ncbi:MAG: HAD family hydrolase [Deltaproteobacteria bacterium]|nr:HAD family hydrolase [Deltaproteobacteria bacterium]
MPALRAIVFDLDDTLYPEQAYVFSGFHAVAAWAETHLGILAKQGFPKLCQLFAEGVRGNTFNRWLESREIKPGDWVPQMVQVYREHKPQIVPYPEVPGLLQKLHQRYRLGLLSDGYAEVQKRKLVALELTSYFDAVVFSDEWGRESWKPKPRPFESVLQRLGVTGPQAAYVADNPAKDFLGARQVGMWTVRVRRQDGLYSRLESPSPEYAPDLEIKTLNELETALICIERRRK